MMNIPVDKVVCFSFFIIFYLRNVLTTIMPSLIKLMICVNFSLVSLFVFFTNFSNFIFVSSSISLQIFFSITNFHIVLPCSSPYDILMLVCISLHVLQKIIVKWHCYSAILLNFNFAKQNYQFLLYCIICLI